MKAKRLCILGGPGSYTLNAEIPGAWYMRVNRRVYDTREEADEAKRRLEGKAKREVGKQKADRPLFP